MKSKSKEKKTDFENCFTEEDIILIWKVCNKISVANISHFNKVFERLLRWIAQKYELMDEAQIDIAGQSNYKYKIHMPDGVDSSGKRKYREISIGEFILQSMDTWNPEKSKYQTYINRLLDGWNWKVPKDKTLEQSSNSAFIYNLKRLLKDNDDYSFDYEDFSVILEKYFPNMPIDRKEELIYTYQSNIQLDDSNYNESGEETSSKKDQIQSPEYDNKEALFDVDKFIGDLYVVFSKLQERTKRRIALYLTIELLKVLSGYVNINYMKLLSNKYPDMLVNLDWIESVHKLKAEGNEATITDLFPSELEQANFLGIEPDRYDDTIRKLKDTKAMKEWFQSIKNHIMV